MEITPIEMVDILNGQQIYDDYNNFVTTKRLVTTDEEGFRAHTYSEPYFTGESLKKVKIYQLDFDRYCKEWGIQKQTQVEGVNTSDLEAQLAEAHQRIEELETQPPAAAEPTTTVNAAKWGNSVTAAFGVWAAIIAGDRTDWKEDEFRAALAERCSDYHTDVHATAWRLLPDAFKHGRGRPKKNPDKSQQSDNS